jgi:hypothetical protein
MNETTKLPRTQNANILGWVGVLLLIASVVVPVYLMHTSSWLAIVGIALTIFAVWRASRWWLLPPAIMLLLTIFMYFLMNKRN